MIDYDLFDIILNKKDESFITKDDILDLDFFINMSKYPASKVMKLFVKKYEPNTLFKVSLKCKECGDVKALGIPKSKIYEICRMSAGIFRTLIYFFKNLNPHLTDSKRHQLLTKPVILGGWHFF